MVCEDCKKRYYIMSGWKILSGFYPNDVNNVFAFREGDLMSFDSKDEVVDYINHIIKQVNEPSNVQKYGKHAKQHQKTANKLSIMGR